MSQPRLQIALLLLGLALLVAPRALAERDLAGQSACLAKALRKHGGGEAGRATAMKEHFDCFPSDWPRFSALFEGAGPLADRPLDHFTLFFATRGSVPDRAWSAKAVGAIAGGEWRAGTINRYATMLRIAINSRPMGPLDAAANHHDAALAGFWQVLFGSPEGLLVDPSFCRGRAEHRACQALNALTAR